MEEDDGKTNSSNQVQGPPDQDQDQDQEQEQEEEHQDPSHPTDTSPSSTQLESSPDTNDEEKHEDHIASTQSSVIVQMGPKPSPDYVHIATISDTDADNPGPRCGHTLTAVLGGDENSKDYVGPRLILFGGATSIEDGSQAVGSQTIGGGAGISNIFLPLPIAIWF